MSVGDWAAAVAAAVGVVGLALLVVQANIARRTFQGQTLIALLYQLQAPEVREARSRLYELVEEKLESPENLYKKRREFEASLHTLDMAAVLIQERMLPKAPLMRDWGGMIARCWADGEAYVRWRRASLDGRPDLWMPLQRLGEEAIKREKVKNQSTPLPGWLRAFCERHEPAPAEPGGPVDPAGSAEHNG